MNTTRNSPIIDRLRTVADATKIALRNPGDTSQAFRIAQALSFNTPERLLARVRRSETGEALLRDKPRLLDVLTDEQITGNWAEGSFGRAYLDFLESEGISAAGLVEASEQGAADYYDYDDPDLVYLQERIRDQHDLWHTLTGYRGDLLGEAGVLAFSFAQTKHPGVGFLAGLGMVFGRSPKHRRFVAQGFRKGRKAAWLPDQPWEQLLALPLDEVRQRLGIEPAGEYEQVREPPQLRLARWLN